MANAVGSGNVALGSVYVYQCNSGYEIEEGVNSISMTCHRSSECLELSVMT